MIIQSYFTGSNYDEQEIFALEKYLQIIQILKYCEELSLTLLAFH